jgi:hypothetical protein
MQTFDDYIMDRTSIFLMLEIGFVAVKPGCVVAFRARGLVLSNLAP